MLLLFFDRLFTVRLIMFSLSFVNGGMLFNHKILSSYWAHNFDRGAIKPD
jgi:hypothetical protein